METPAGVGVEGDRRKPSKDCLEVQWFYKRRERWEAFGEVENSALEDALQQGRRVVDFGLGKYPAVLAERKQYNHDAGTHRQLLRGTWYFQRNDGTLCPYPEDVAEALEVVLHYMLLSARLSPLLALTYTALLALTDTALNSLVSSPRPRELSRRCARDPPAPAPCRSPFRRTLRLRGAHKWTAVARCSGRRKTASSLRCSRTRTRCDGSLSSTLKVRSRVKISMESGENGH